MVVKVWNLGEMSYDRTLRIQQAISRRHLAAMSQRVDTNHDTILLVQHKPVYTAGVRDSTPIEEANRLRGLGAQFRKTTRGGLTTFHGPGQLVAYPILNLKHFKTSVRWYIHALEETVIRLCQMMGVKADRSEHTGIWVHDNKLASIGIHTNRYVTTHGISLNCDNDLSWFDQIDPCGMGDLGATSLAEETYLESECRVENVAPLFIKCFEKVFECEAEELEKDVQDEIMEGIRNQLLSHTMGNSGNPMSEPVSIQSISVS